VYLNSTDFNKKQPMSQIPNKWNDNYIVYTKDSIREVWNTFLNFTSPVYLDKFLKDQDKDNLLADLVKTNSFLL
jgi:hypothetical protein